MSDVIWVDETDEVLGEIPRTKAHAEGLLHRVSVVYVGNGADKILVNERAKDGHLDHSSAGHVDVGESYEEAARRELEEELGIAGVGLREVGQSRARDTGKESDTGAVFDSKHMFKIFFCTASPHDVILDTDEVKSVYWETPANIMKDMRENPEKYTEGFKETIKVFIEWNSAKIQ